uniref:HrcA domain-containing protein n=1 Tax=Ascaris lumbricoides TaxID=6252 RepID=A0A0M3I8L5_ASCLU
MSLLESLGQNAYKHDEVQVGRDESVSILGMPVGRRDGLLLSPLEGLSYGNQDMYGPVAINDKYNVKWGFLDKLGSLLSSASQ